MRLLMASGDRQVAVGEKGPFHSMLREFSRHFERIDVLCPRPDRPVTTHTVYDNVHLHPADCGRLGMVGYIEKRGTELVREQGCELIVSHDYGWFYNGLGSARVSEKTGVPYLSELHHVPGHPRAANARERLDKLAARAYVRWAQRRAIAFRVVNSGEMPELLSRWGVPREMIRVIPSLYIDLDVFRPADPHEPDGGVRSRDIDVLFVGRMVANKGLENILAALALLAEGGSPLRALFVGRGPLLERTQLRARELKLFEHVRFLEWVDTAEDLAAIYRASRLCVCASTCEGGPRVTVEAMACGTPVVSTKVGVMSELLSDGACGSLCGFDARSIADAIDAQLADEDARRARGREAHQRVQRFEYSAAIQNYADELKLLAREARV